MNTNELEANIFQYETIHAATFWNSFCSNYSYFFFFASLMKEDMQGSIHKGI